MVAKSGGAMPRLHFSPVAKFTVISLLPRPLWAVTALTPLPSIGLNTGLLHNVLGTLGLYTRLRMPLPSACSELSAPCFSIRGSHFSPKLYSPKVR